MCYIDFSKDGVYMDEVQKIKVDIVCDNNTRNEAEIIGLFAESLCMDTKRVVFYDSEDIEAFISEPGKSDITLMLLQGMKVGNRRYNVIQGRGNFAQNKLPGESNIKLVDYSKSRRNKSGVVINYGNETGNEMLSRKYLGMGYDLYIGNQSRYLSLGMCKIWIMLFLEKLASRDRDEQEENFSWEHCREAFDSCNTLLEKNRSFVWHR
jgi:hypothetical protein